MNAVELLGGRKREDGWSFSIGRELHGAFGGAFGGAVAAACVIAARSAAPGRVPSALDCRFLRGLPAGDARAVPSVVHAGRTSACVSVDVLDANGRLCTRALATLVAADALVPVERLAQVPPLSARVDGQKWGSGVAPIVDVLKPVIVGRDGPAIATSILLPWDSCSDGEDAEAVCFAADLCVGPPVAAAVTGERAAHPNPDVSLRFAGPVQSRELVAWGRTARASGGVAVVSIEVLSKDAVVGVGVSSSLLLPAQ